MLYTKHKELLAGLTIIFGKELDLKTLKTSLTSRCLKVQGFEVNIELEPFFRTTIRLLAGQPGGCPIMMIEKLKN